MTQPMRRCELRRSLRMAIGTHAFAPRLVGSWTNFLGFRSLSLTPPQAIEFRRVATHMPLRRDSYAVASRFECRCVAIRMSALRDSIVVGFPSVDWVAPTFRHVFFSKGRAGGSSPYLVPRSNSAVDGDLAFRPALRPIYSGGRNVRPRLEAMQGRGGRWG